MDVLHLKFLLLINIFLRSLKREFSRNRGNQANARIVRQSFELLFFAFLEESILETIFESYYIMLQ